MCSSDLDYDCAFHYFNKLLKEKPENTDLLTHIGNCYLYMGDMDLASEREEEVHETDRLYINRLSDYCFMLMRLEEHQPE